MRGEKVAIFGDYDVDGATSSALLARFLRAAGLDPMIHIPDRIFEGYGPNVEAIRSLAERGAKLLITVDCGTTSIEPLAEARRLGLDVIVIDHHQADERLPDALVVNPNRLDDLSELGHLAAVGLVFLTVVAVNRVLRQRGFWSEARPEPDLLGDARHRCARHRRRRGAAQGAQPRLRLQGTDRDAAARKPGPHRADGRGAARPARRSRGISASCSGRGSTPAAGSAAPISACGCCWRTIRPRPARIAAELDRLNRERQAIEQGMLAEAEAEAMAALGLEEKGAVVVTAAANWHPGVVGLIAARLKERFNRPAFAIALEPGGTGTGSGRSIQGVDLGKAVRQRRDGGPASSRAAAMPWRRASRLSASGLRRFAPISKTTLAGAVEAARLDRCAADRRRGQRGRRRRRADRDAGARGPVRLRQSRAGDRIAGAHRDLRRQGRRKSRAGAAASPATARSSMPSRSAPTSSRWATR